MPTSQYILYDGRNIFKIWAYQSRTANSIWFVSSIWYILLYIYIYIYIKLYISTFLLPLKVSIQKQKNSRKQKSQIFDDPKK